MNTVRIHQSVHLDNGTPIKADMWDLPGVGQPCLNLDMGECGQWTFAFHASRETLLRLADAITAAARDYEQRRAAQAEMVMP